MTLQKAMRVRVELKKEISNLNDLIHDYSHQISFKGKVPGAEELSVKRAEKVAALYGMSYEEVVKRMFTKGDSSLFHTMTSVPGSSVLFHLKRNKGLVRNST